ncbi:preprotein translocase subunit SecG [Candidatus Gottesmanbacteria bacterium RIFCSPHIGHO2_01_FULL_39_10]|uniref:Protein-export membrane protein SecG n=1 Tax=Candidatus Gottesmanbacteria bacterium RIFCSPHIGHO2_01_FULL_39_10 TaxID=1798375 RepID=A0A1F5ZKF6_9BACT|nr:MAG: preprotein translocase subunit SecG [Candidatus Gottesmanbacteria bacterium RIFCSPHIGHO2_01_FULL_39_10]
MKQILIILQIVIAISLAAIILLQSKGVGLGHAWGGSGDFYKNRRGVEKLLFNSTVVLAILFLIFSLLAVILS